MIYTGDGDFAVYNSISVMEQSSSIDLKLGIQKSPNSWGLDRIDQQNLPLDSEYKFGNATGTGVIVFVLDSGVRLSHDEFEGRAQCSKNFVPNEDCDDNRGHGTHVAATIGGATFGVAKGVDIRAVKVMGSSGETSYSALIAGINHVIVHRVLRLFDPRPIVMNISVGGKRFANLNLAASIAANIGIVVVASAGNKGDDACKYSPGSAWGAITVGATNRNDARPWFSNYGSCVNLFAPGNRILSASSQSDSSTEVRSGTSMASPHVAGAVALYIERYPHLGATKIKEKLLEDALQGAVSRAGFLSSNQLLQI